MLAIISTGARMKMVKANVHLVISQFLTGILLGTIHFIRLFRVVITKTGNAVILKKEIKTYDVVNPVNVIIKPHIIITLFLLITHI